MTITSSSLWEWRKEKSLFLFPQCKGKSNPAYGGLNYSHKKLQFCPILKKLDTERFFGTAKQEEIYVVGSYPDERTGRDEIGTYITSYNTERPHQALWNFTPAMVHELNNNTLLLEKLAELKYEARMKRKLYWEGRTL